MTPIRPVYSMHSGRVATVEYWPHNWWDYGCGTRGPRKGLTATGTTTGYRRHRRAGERACAMCARANRDATRRARTPVGRPTLSPGVQAAAAAATVAELVRMGRVGPADAALVETVLGLAEMCDANPWNPSMWGVYKRALAALQSD